MTEQMFAKGYDLRFGVTMAIPVAINDILVRLFWTVRGRCQYQPKYIRWTYKEKMMFGFKFTQKPWAQGMPIYKRKNLRKTTDEWIKKTLLEIKKLDPINRAISSNDKTFASNLTGLNFADVPLTERENIEFETEKRIRYSDRDSFGDSKQKAFSSWANEIKTETFSEALTNKIVEKGLSNREFYSAALIDRKLFSAMKNNKNYHPKKETAMACCIGLKLNLEEAEKLLGIAGYKLSLGIPEDRVVYYCLSHGITDIDIVNELLYAEGEKCLGM